MDSIASYLVSSKVKSVTKSLGLDDDEDDSKKEIEDEEEKAVRGQLPRRSCCVSRPSSRLVLHSPSFPLCCACSARKRTLRRSRSAWRRSGPHAASSRRSGAPRCRPSTTQSGISTTSPSRTDQRLPAAVRRRLGRRRRPPRLARLAATRPRRATTAALCRWRAFPPLYPVDLFFPDGSDCRRYCIVDCAASTVCTRTTSVSFLTLSFAVQGGLHLLAAQPVALRTLFRSGLMGCAPAARLGSGILHKYGRPSTPNLPR